MPASVVKVQTGLFTLARVILGIVFFAHGWQKVFTYGLDGAAANFAKMGVPMPTASAWFAGIAELAGGALLVFGLAVPIVAVVLIVDMLGAIVFVHLDKGLLAAGGYELPLVLIAGLIAIAAVSHVSVGADAALVRRRQRV